MPASQTEGGRGRCVRAIAGREVAFDDEGFFESFEEWSEGAFEELARESGLQSITERHRGVIRFLREYYAYNGRAPLNNQIRTGTGMSLLELDDLFPEGIKMGARRLAGLPNPKTCS